MMKFFIIIKKRDKIFRKGDVKKASAPRIVLLYSGGFQGVSP